MGRKLLCILLAVAGIILWVWFKPWGEDTQASFRPQATVPEATAQVLSKPQTLTFPIAMGDGELVAESLQAYDGLYLEDGSNDKVTGVAALMVRNAGDRDISSAMVTVEQAGQRLHFFVTWLPAGGRVLVLEYGRAAFGTGPITECSVAGVRWESFYAEGLLFRESEHGQLLVTNDKGRSARNIRLRYKLYVIGEDYYLGGITFCTYVGDLGSGESRYVLPQWYALGHTVVVALLED